MPVMGESKFEQFFRTVASLDVDKDDLKRYGDLVNHKIRDLVVVGVAAAAANGREVMQPSDLPITKGFEQSIHEFRQLDLEIELQPILDQLATYPPLHVPLSVETEAELSTIAGGLGVALARTFKIIDPTVKNPQSEHWERAVRAFDLLL
jgi:Domain of unknown function (DUF1931)